MSVELKQGDCLEVMRTLPSNSIDTCITDPPYALEFMGKGWDKVLPSVEVWREVLRVLKPGAMLMAFGGDRTHHRLMVNIEDAGFEIRTCMYWIFGQGFPKSLDIEKSMRKQFSEDALCVCVRHYSGITQDSQSDYPASHLSHDEQPLEAQDSVQDVSPSPNETHGRSRVYQQKDGQVSGQASIFPDAKTAHPSSEDYLPHSEHRVTNSQDSDNTQFGMTLNKLRVEKKVKHKTVHYISGKQNLASDSVSSSFLHDGERNSNIPLCPICGKLRTDTWKGYGSGLKPAAEIIVLAMKPLDGTFAQNAQEWGVAGLNIDAGRISTNGEVVHAPQSDPSRREGVVGTDLGISRSSREEFNAAQRESVERTNSLGRWPANLLLDEEAAGMLGEPSRFFYTAKASKGERNAGLDSMESIAAKRTHSGGADTRGRPVPENRNVHPTVKPLALMEYLCKLTRTPTGGIVLDPFMGSGTTGLACVNTGRSFIGIEIDAGYFAIAEKRVPHDAPCGDAHAMRDAGESLPSIARKLKLSVPEVARMLRGAV